MGIQSNNFLKEIGRSDDKLFKLATVSEVIGTDIYLTFYGEETQSGKNYKYLSSYKPAVGDTVCVSKINESWLVLGKVSSQYENNAGSASELYYLENTSSGQVVRLNFLYYSNTTRDHVFRPSISGYVDLGASSYKYQDIYATNGTIQTSDQREKEEIRSLDKRYLDLFANLLPKSFRFVDGRSGRRHIGFISQEVEAAMEKCGISNLEFAGFIKSPVYEIVDGKETENIVDYIYGLRYEEFIGILTYVLQDVISFIGKLGYGKEEVSDNEKS